jgi:heme a synthase
MNAARGIRGLAVVGVLLCFGVVVLGSYVRLTAAGLGCPDWPGCYGHLTPVGAERNPGAHAVFPATPFDAGKAWREMLHRYAAGTLGLIVLAIAALAVHARGRTAVRPAYAFVLLALVIVQALLGMLTVTWQLKPLAVTLHLLFGLTTLAMLWWLWLGTRSAAAQERGISASPASRHVRMAVIVALSALALQVALGGWTSSNYAAAACPDFPTCQGAWWPAVDFEDAFVLWRGLGINYEGGVLDHPARAAIHLTHRLGAVAASVALVLAALLALRHTVARGARRAAWAVLAALALQLAIGVFMVLEAFPLPLAALHNAGAALLTLAAVALHRFAGERA